LLTPWTLNNEMHIERARQLFIKEMYLDEQFVSFEDVMRIREQQWV